MSKLLAVAIFDKAMSLYNRPFYVPAPGAAIRSFQDEINRQADDNLMFKHPSDYEIYSVGFFEEETGLLISDTPHLLCSGAQLVYNLKAASAA